MKKVNIEDIEHVGHPAGVNSVRKFCSDALATTGFAFVYYELEPGDSFSGGHHRHHDQEEVFYVLSGKATFDVRETADAETETVAVTEGEAVRFPPGEFQYGYNDSDERVVALAFAAPETRHDWHQLDWLTRCRDCDEETVHDVRLTEERDIVATCNRCGKTVRTG